MAALGEKDRSYQKKQTPYTITSQSPGWRSAYHFSRLLVPSSPAVGDLSGLGLEARLGQGTPWPPYLGLRRSSRLSYQSREGRSGGRAVPRGTDQQFPVGIVNQHQNPWPPAGETAVSSGRAGEASPVRGGRAARPFLWRFPPKLSQEAEATLQVQRNPVGSSRSPMENGCQCHYHTPDLGPLFCSPEHPFPSLRRGDLLCLPHKLCERPWGRRG